MAVARLIVTADNKLALKRIQEVSVAAGASAEEISAADAKIAASNERASASFAAMKRGMSLVGTIGAAAVAFGMDKAVKSALAWQVQQTALQQALRNTGNFSAAAMRQINAEAEALATHGGFSESQQLPALTQLIGLTGSYTAAQKLNVAATNLARGAHLDYQSAISKVEGAMIGQTRGIAKYAGIIVPVTKYTYGWTAAMKAADAAGYAQAVRLNKQATAQEILGMVQKKYGDQTTAYSHTVAGALSNVRNSFEILLRQLGQMLLPTINTVARVFADIGAWMSSHMGVVRDIAKQFLAVGLAVGSIVVAYKAWNMAVRIGDALAMASPWQRALMAIALLASVVITHWNQIGGVITGIFHAIGSAVDAVGNAINAVIRALVTAVKWAVKLFNDTPLGGLFNFGKNLIGGIFSGNLNEIANAPGALLKGATFGAVNVPTFGPMAQSSQASNSSVPVVSHRAGGDIHHNTHVTVQLDGRVLAEQTVHQVLKRAALA